MPNRNTVLRRQARKLIYNVLQYMIKEKEEGVQNVIKVHSELLAIKGYVAAKNVSWTVDRAMELVREKVDAMGQREWTELCKKVKEVEEAYRQSDHVVDEMTDQFIIRPGDSSSESESESDYSDSDIPTPSTSRETFMEGMMMNDGGNSDSD